MTRHTITTFDPDDRVELAAAADWLRSGRLLVYPTETFYGLGTDPRSREGVVALLTAKGAREGALPLIASDLQQVDAIARGWREIGDAARLARSFWPGPLTLVLPASGSLADGVAAADGTVAVRVSAHRDARRLAHAVGSAIVATSANRSGEAPALSPDAACAAWEGLASLAVIDGGPLAGGAPSTILDPRSSPPALLREGACSTEAIERALRPDGSSSG